MNAIFFGRAVGVSCLRCGEFERTERGHRYCAQLSCPVGLLELQRRRRQHVGRAGAPEEPLLIGGA